MGGRCVGYKGSGVFVIRITKVFVISVASVFCHNCGKCVLS